MTDTPPNIRQDDETPEDVKDAATVMPLRQTSDGLEVFMVRRHGDSAMDFIWRHKGALAVTGILATFLADPRPYFSGARELVVEPVVQPIAEGVNWTLLLLALLLVAFLPTILRVLLRSVKVVAGK